MTQPTVHAFSYLTPDEVGAHYEPMCRRYDLDANLNGVRNEVSRQLADAEQHDDNALIEALRTIHADIVAVQALAHVDRPNDWTGGAS